MTIVRNQYDIAVGGNTDEEDTLERIDRMTKRLNKVHGYWIGVNISLSLQSHRDGVPPITKRIRSSLIEMFQTIARARRRSLSFLNLVTDFIKTSDAEAGLKPNKLFLRIDPAIRDDENFRAILEVAMKSMVLKDLKINGHGRSYPIGTIGNSLSSNILESSTLHEFKLERFDSSVGVVPISGFLDSLSKGHANSSNQLEVLGLYDVGISDIQANELLRHLPDTIRVLDLSKNEIEGIPTTTHIHHSSQLRELNLGANPCLCFDKMKKMEDKLKNLKSLLIKFPCLVDLGPYEEWGMQFYRGHLRSRRPLSFQLSDAKIMSSQQHLIDQIHTVADQNRCKTRFSPMNKILATEQLLWPHVFGKTESWLSRDGTYEGPRVLEESKRSSKERQASIIFSILQENATLIACRAVGDNKK